MKRRLIECGRWVSRGSGGGGPQQWPVVNQKRCVRSVASRKEAVLEGCTGVGAARGAYACLGGLVGVRGYFGAEVPVFVCSGGRRSARSTGQGGTELRGWCGVWVGWVGRVFCRSAGAVRCGRGARRMAMQVRCVLGAQALLDSHVGIVGAQISSGLWVHMVGGIFSVHGARSRDTGSYAGVSYCLGQGRSCGRGQEGIVVSCWSARSDGNGQDQGGTR